MKRLYVIPILLGLLWTVLLAALFVWNAVGERRHVTELAEHQAMAFFQQIVTTRSWNSGHGGVFVPLGPAAPPNEHLAEAERQLRTEDGQVLVRMNPAYMTRQVADIAMGSAGVRFHITSLNPIRPENGPDPWELEALRGLVPADDRFELVPGPEGPGRTERGQYRYLAPLVAEESCLRCHPGEQVGAVRGAISVSVPAEPLLASLEGNLRKQATAYSIIWLVGLLGIGGSTWEISRKRDRAEHLSRVKSRFLANMSHDMRTPLTGIIGLTERMLRTGLEAGNERYARLISHSAGTLLEVVNDILDFARLDSGRLDLDARPFDLRGAVDRTVRIFAFAAEDKGLELSAEIAESVPARLVGDGFRYRQVLANLLGNAVKFTERGLVRLAVTAEPAGDGTVLLKSTVADSGVGIPPDHLEAIFDSFTQADASLSRRHAGSGLGLSIARQLARMMGGDILVRSEAGRGSEFTFIARLDPAPAEQAAQGEVASVLSPEAEVALPGIRVLAVDDHSVNRVLLSDILSEAGARAVLASGGREALSIFGRERFDAVLMDLQMPDLDGVETTRRMRESERARGLPRTPVIVLTAFASLGDMGGDTDELPMEDVDGFLTKPIDVALLKRTLLETVSGRKTEVMAGPATPIGPAPAGPAVPLLEPSDALRLLGGRQDLYRILAGEFLSGAPDLRSDLSAAVARDDRREVARLVHTLKSGSATLGALRLRDSAARLEALAREGGVAPEEWNHLTCLLDDTLQAIERADLTRPWP